MKKKANFIVSCDYIVVDSILYFFHKFHYIQQVFFYSFLVGSILPDIDIFITYFFSIFKTDSKHYYLTDFSMFHSIFFAAFTYLLLLIIYEIKKPVNSN